MRKPVLGRVLATLLTGVSACAQGAAAPVDLLLVNAAIETMVPGAPRAAALAVRGDRIVAVGSEADMRTHAGPATRVLDAEGHLVVPGFIEGHGHFMSLGEKLGVLDLRNAADWNQIVALVAEAASKTPAGEWISGMGWHQEKWVNVPAGAVGGVPLNRLLNDAASRHPVLLEHASGHGLIANDVALALAGIDADTPDPAGGSIARDSSGRATGWLVDTAADGVWGARRRAEEARGEERQRAEFAQRVRLAGAEALSKGVTSFQDAGSSFAVIDGLRALAERGELPLRLYVMVGQETNERMAQDLARHRVIGHANNFLTVRAIKRVADGALGSRSALLLEPYTDDPASTGLRVDTLETIRGTGELALANGYQLNTHAIGDRANREILDLYGELLGGVADGRARRWRIEHAQHVHPQEFPRFAQIGVIASMQGVHATSDGPWVPKRLGEDRARERTYVWRSLLDAGAMVTNGTDVPVEDIDPLASFRASVTREMADGRRFHAEQRMTRREALESYTRHNAYAAFEEDLKGTLESGKLADFVVLSHDILTVPDEALAEARVLHTVLGGKLAYSRAR